MLKSSEDLFIRFGIVTFLAVALALPFDAANAGVDVTFTGAEGYTDGTFRNFRSEKNRAETQDALRKVFAKLGDRYLAPDATLTVDVTSLDLAGRFEPGRTNVNGIRFMSEVAWPRMTFSYRVMDKGMVVASGTGNVADMNYLARAGTYFDNDPLRYERRMLQAWFARTFRNADKNAGKNIGAGASR